MTFTGWLFVFLIWILFFFLYRDYRLDLFRQRLFALRDELFDLALDGKIDFESRAYGMLRSTINGSIQFGHRLEFINLLFIMLAGRGLDEKAVDNFDLKWKSALERQPQDVQRDLRRIRNKLHVFTIEQVIFTSFTLMFSAVTLVGCFLMLVLKLRLQKKIRRLISKERSQKFLSMLDLSAFMQSPNNA